MSVARELFIKFGGPLAAPDHEETYERMLSAGELWRAEGHYFSAGLAMSQATFLAWGDLDKMSSSMAIAISDFEHAVLVRPSQSLESIAAYHELIKSLSQASWLFDVNNSQIVTRRRELMSELAQHLIRKSADEEGHADNYLVRGIVLRTDLDSEWEATFPPFEVPLGVAQIGQEVILNIPSAFQIFVRDGDWRGAYDIVQSRNSAFATVGVRGWKAVTLAHMENKKAVMHYDEAARIFGSDTAPTTPEETTTSGRGWTGINSQLWAKYFRARARLVESIENPAKVKQLLGSARESLLGTDSGWHSGEVSRFKVLIRVLENLISNPSTHSIEDATKQYQSEIQLTGENDDDRLALAFISEAGAGIRGFQTDPSTEITQNHLSVALDALAKISLIGPDVAEVIRPQVGKNAISIVLGPYRTWIHRALESIEDEARFRRILLRLLQAGLPLYAQLRHGPIEYGKDIVTLTEVDKTIVLRHYQVKCGDIDKNKWRESKNELEEMFLVPFTSFQLPVLPNRTEGVLITNGHANAYVEPVMNGWLETQQSEHARVVEFMHIDSLVEWIFKDRLINELKIALMDEGIDIAKYSTGD